MPTFHLWAAHPAPFDRDAGGQEHFEDIGAATTVTLLHDEISKDRSCVALCFRAGTHVGDGICEEGVDSRGRLFWLRKTRKRPKLAKHRRNYPSNATLDQSCDLLAVGVKTLALRCAARSLHMCVVSLPRAQAPTTSVTHSRRALFRAKHHPDLIMCRKLPGIAIGRLCEKCESGRTPPTPAVTPATGHSLQRTVAHTPPAGDGKCVICDSYVRPATLVRVCDECNYGSYAGRCVICGGVGISDAYYCKECTMQEKDVRAAVCAAVMGVREALTEPPPACAERRVSKDRQPRECEDGLVLRAQEMCVLPQRTRGCVCNLVQCF